MVNYGINDSRKIMCSRTSEVSVERITVCYVIENLTEHDIQCTCHVPIFMTS